MLSKNGCFYIDLTHYFIYPGTEEEFNALREQFGSPSQQSKKPRYSNEDLFENLEVIEKSNQTPPKPPTCNQKFLESPKKGPENPFTKTGSNGNKFSGLSKLAQFRKATVNNTNTVQSRYVYCIQFLLTNILLSVCINNEVRYKMPRFDDQ